jgi:hypothetical protein
MGEYYLYANVAKREFLYPGHFGADMKRRGLLVGHVGIAVGLLLCKGVAGHPLCGSWSGDEVIITGDEGTHASTDGSDRNLYSQARNSFRDISAEAIAMLCLFREELATEFAERAKENKHLLWGLSEIVFQSGCEPLEKALVAAMGQAWATGIPQHWHSSKRDEGPRGPG